MEARIKQNQWLVIVVFLSVLLPNAAQGQELPEMAVSLDSVAVVPLDPLLIPATLTGPANFLERGVDPLPHLGPSIAEERSRWPAMGLGALLGAAAGAYAGYRDCLEVDAMICVPILHVAVGGGVGGLLGYLIAAR